MAEITLEKIREATGDMADQVTDAVKKAIDELGLATKEDIEELKKEISSLTIKVEE